MEKRSPLIWLAKNQHLHLHMHLLVLRTQCCANGNYYTDD